MQNKLLIKFEKYLEAHRVKHYCAPDNVTNSKLDRLTKSKLAAILALKADSESLNVLIIEADELEFLSAFMAAEIASVNVFLADPAWQQREWQQVFDLVTPDLILGDRPDFDAEQSNAQPTTVKHPESLIMIPTGGTSGKVRFAMHTWSTLGASVFGFGEYFNCQAINSCCTLPLHHVSGLMQFMRSFLTQGELFLSPYKAIGKDKLAIPQDYFISLVPTQLQYLIELMPEYLAQFKTVLVGGAPTGRSLLAQARQYNIPVATTYGMTETASGIVTLKPEDFLAGNNSSGRVLPHAQITVEDNQSENIGLISITCASLFLGYYPDLGKTELLTDDLGYSDRDNYWHIVGRSSHKIITGGENVYPAEVEGVIWSTQLVLDVAVVGVENPQWGQVVTAICVLAKPDLDLNLIAQAIQPQLAKYKQPKAWIIVDRLPRNDRGKLNYQELQAIAIKRHDKKRLM